MPSTSTPLQIKKRQFIRALKNEPPSNQVYNAYSQGKGKYCALGVGFNLLVNAKNGTRKVDYGKSDVDSIMGSASAKAFGLTESESTMVVTLNDSAHWSFADIAAWLEGNKAYNGQRNPNAKSN